MKFQYTIPQFPGLLLPPVIALISFLHVAKTQAQDLTPVVRRQLATQEVQHRLDRENPELKASRQRIALLLAGNLRGESEAQLTIPLVFHIVYHNQSERVGEDQVLSQLEALNRDFGSAPAVFPHPADSLEGFAARAANARIGFCLASVPGSASPGIHYVQSDGMEWSTDDALKFRRRGGADAIFPERCLNIWVARLENNISGYAQMPGGPSATDGIVLDYRFLGSLGTAKAPYDQGKTLTHLVGNYLGLNDLWGNGHCADDGVDDTPPHNAPNFGCPGYRHISTCDDNPVEMTMNFMDNTDDACMYMFTAGQVKRMRAALSENGPRAGLYNNNYTCSSPGAGPGLPPSDIQGAAVLQAVQVFPNPASRDIRLQIATGMEGDCSLSICNAFGTVLYR
ncbi:MAG: hypothetical protein RI973_1728, partial [Bacteroidota bacterium]